MAAEEVSKTGGRAFFVLGGLWLAFVVFQLVVWLGTHVGGGEPAVAILLRIAIAAVAIVVARRVRAGTLPVSVPVAGAGFAVATGIIAVLGFGMSVSPGSSLGFMSFSYSRAVNVFLPEVRQGMDGASPATQGGVLLYVLVLLVASVVSMASGPSKPSKSA